MIRRTPAKGGKSVRITFALPTESPQGPVSVVGDFNAWTPGKHTFVKRSNGTRSVSVSLPPGTQARFRYLGQHGHWFDDQEADGLDEAGGVLHL